MEGPFEIANKGAVWPITKVVVGQRSRKRLGDIAKLMESIRAVGLLHPIVVHPGGQLVAGFRRLEAVKRLGLTEVEVTVAHTVDDEVAALRAEADENTCREAWSVADINAHAKREKPKEREKAKEREKEGKKLGGKAKAAGEKLSHQQKKARTEDALAAATGVSGKTLDKIEAVYTAAEDDKTMAPVVEAMEADDKVDSAHKIAQWTKSDRRQYAKLYDWGWSNGEVVRFRDLVEQLPEDEQMRARAVVMGEKQPVPGSFGKKILGNLIQMPAAKRRHVYELHESDDERDRTTAASLAIGNPPPADPRLARLVEMARELRRMGTQWKEEKPSRQMVAAADQLDKIAEQLRQQTRERGKS